MKEYAFFADMQQKVTGYSHLPMHQLEKHHQSLRSSDTITENPIAVKLFVAFYPIKSILGVFSIKMIASKKRLATTTQSIDRDDKAFKCDQ